MAITNATTILEEEIITIKRFASVAFPLYVGLAQVLEYLFEKRKTRAVICEKNRTSKVTISAANTKIDQSNVPYNKPTIYSYIFNLLFI